MKYKIEKGVRSDIDGGEYDIYNVYQDDKYLFSCDSQSQVEQGISKRENAILKRKSEIAAAAFVFAHDGSKYLTEPFTNPRSGMGRKG